MEEEAISEDSQSGDDPPTVTLVLGGARSGKSRFAENLIPATGGGTYIAAAEARDSEMAERIAAHQSRRGLDWQTIEAPIDLVGALDEAEAAGNPTMLDCLTIWLSNLMEAQRDIENETIRLTTRLSSLGCPVVVVSNEVGQGIVPSNALARRFRDHAGRLNQAVAECADRVFFVTAGLPAQLK